MSVLYVYCVTENTDGCAAAGVNGLPVETLRYRGLCLVHSALRVEKVPSVEENFYAHENVLEEMMRRGAAILPFRFGTCLCAETGKTLLKDQYGVFKKNLRRLTGKVEMSVRALWEYVEAVEEAKRVLEVPRVSLANEKVNAYFNRKMEDYKLVEGVKRRAQGEAEKIHRRILECGDLEGTFQLMKTEAMFFSAFYLVRKEDAGAFAQGIKAVRVEFGNYKFLATGPWPPYNFCNLTI